MEVHVHYRLPAYSCHLQPLLCLLCHVVSQSQLRLENTQTVRFDVFRVQDDAARAGAAGNLEDAEVAHSMPAVPVAQPCSGLQSRQAVP